MRRDAAAALAIVLVLGGAWRGLQARARYHEPLGFGDERMYFAMGAGLQDGRVLGETGRPWRPTARRAPLYPSLISAVAGRPPQPGRVRMVQAALSCVELLLAFALGASLHSPLAGAAGAAFVAANSALAAWTGTVYIETVYGFLVLCAAAALALWASRPDAWRSAALGAVLGTTLLCRSNLFAAPVLCAGWLARRGPGPGSGRPGRGPGARRAALALLLCAAAPLAPWALRNACRFGRFIPFEDRAVAHALYLASAGAARAPSDFGFAADRTPLMEAQAGALMGAKDSETLYGGLSYLAFQNLWRRPWAYAWGWAKRCAAMLAVFVRLAGWPCAALLIAGWPLLTAPAWRALYLLFLYYLAVLSLVAFQDRYLLPVLPLALTLAAAALAELTARLEGRAKEPEALAQGPAAGRAASAGFVLAFGALACMAFVSVLRLAQEAADPVALRARDVEDRGWRAFEAGRLDEAERAFSAAVVLDPASPEPWLGRANARKGEGALADVNVAIARAWRPWSAELDDVTAAWAAAAFERRAALWEAQAATRTAGPRVGA
ncbi:MAG: hypothetical protein NTX64_04900, partial [Elusimicrobia bacterium]|nr:hypothetical protein [Elusimicrobiota bacterium]